MLSPYRVLDLTTERGLLCGQILGDLGADVMQVEPPGGSPARRLGPFYRDIPSPDGSLFWWAYNRNKRSITLDITSSDGQAILCRLVASAPGIKDRSKHCAALQMMWASEPGVPNESRSG